MLDNDAVMQKSSMTRQPRKGTKKGNSNPMLFLYNSLCRKATPRQYSKEKMFIECNRYHLLSVEQFTALEEWRACDGRVAARILRDGIEPIFSTSDKDANYNTPIHIPCCRGSKWSMMYIGNPEVGGRIVDNASLISISCHTHDELRGSLANLTLTLRSGIRACDDGACCAAATARSRSCSRSTLEYLGSFRNLGTESLFRQQMLRPTNSSEANLHLT